MKKTPLPREFHDGGKVKELLNGKTVTITSARWNGYTWMYSFKETEMSCGEGYLTDLTTKLKP
jgi:hypothetical protein